MADLVFISTQFSQFSIRWPIINSRLYYMFYWAVLLFHTDLRGLQNFLPLVGGRLWRVVEFFYFVLFVLLPKNWCTRYKARWSGMIVER